MLILVDIANVHVTVTSLTVTVCHMSSS